MTDAFTCMFDNYFLTSWASAISHFKINAVYPPLDVPHRRTLDRLTNDIHLLDCTCKALHELSLNRIMRRLAVLKVGTDCSGMEAPVQACRNLKLFFKHVFSSDIDSHCRTTILSNFPGGIIYDDLLSRDNRLTPKCDFYVAGFPCQPFSTAGERKGFDDSRGQVHLGCGCWLFSSNSS